MWGYGGGYNNKKNDDMNVQERDNPWMEKQVNVVKYSYSIVQKIFDTKSQDGEIIEKFLENGTIEKLIERVGHLTGEKGRTKKDTLEVQLEKQKSLEISPGKKTLKRDLKREGVGYTTGIGKIWDVSKYLKNKEAKSLQITEIMGIIQKVLERGKLIEKH
jgi:hypothetical protein